MPRIFVRGKYLKNNTPKSGSEEHQKMPFAACNKKSLPLFGRDFSLFYDYFLFVLCLVQEAEKYTRSHCRTNHTCYVRSHSVHKKIIAAVVFQSHLV